MKNKGFTLIELLAVIVILAIIALIATPIILGIINDARDESNKRSIELYASAVENAIIAYQLKEDKKPTTIDQVKDYIKYEGSEVVCATKLLKENGTIYLANCTVGDQPVDYEYGKAPACTVVKQDSTKYSVGDEVTCTLSESTDKFYVIEEASLTTTSLKMLTEKNINTTTYRQSDNAGTIAFSSTNYWLEETDPAYVYGDHKDAEGNQQNLVYPIVEEYVSYLNTKLTRATGSLLTYSQVENLGCDLVSCSNTPEWVYSTNYWTGIGNNYEDGDGNDFGLVYYVDSYLHFNFLLYNNAEDYGVRPVITISSNDIK